MYGPLYIILHTNMFDTLHILHYTLRVDTFLCDFQCAISLHRRYVISLL